MITPSIKSTVPSKDKFPSSSGNGNFKLKTEDFIKMMITQLQNQDPLEPAKNQELSAHQVAGTVLRFNDSTHLTI